MPETVGADIRHRDNLGPRYRGIAIHALPGLHEFVGDLASELFTTKEQVLELGAGSGALSLRLRDRGFDVLPVDLDGRDWKLEIPLIEADLNFPEWFGRLPVSSVGQIVALELIEHLENPAKFFRDIAQLLAQGGILMLSTPNVASFYSVHAAFKRGEFALFSPRDCVESGHISILPWWLLEHHARASGLSLLRCTGVCKVPMGRSKRMIHRLVVALRARVFGPKGFKNPEGLNVVMVFRKGNG